MKSLSEICQIHLMRHCNRIEGVNNVPYRLISGILEKLKLDQLRKLESTNVLLLLEDEELWLKLLTNNFPTNVHEIYISKKDKIINYYISYFEENDPLLVHDNEELLRNWIQQCIKKNPDNGKYRLPYRMLYDKYESDMIEKQEESARRLRQQMRQIEEQRQKKQTELIEGKSLAFGTSRRSGSNNERSELFRKSLKDHKDRLQHFKSGGFDVTRRLDDSKRKVYNNRVAFGGGSGSINTNKSSIKVSAGYKDERIDTSNQAKPALSPGKETPKENKPIVKKRRSEREEPSIFLKNKRPNMIRRVFDTRPSRPEHSNRNTEINTSPVRHRNDTANTSPVRHVNVSTETPKIGKRKKSSFFNLK